MASLVYDVCVKLRIDSGELSDAEGDIVQAAQNILGPAGAGVVSVEQEA